MDGAKWTVLGLALLLALGATGCLSDEGNKVGAPGEEETVDDTPQMDQDPEREPPVTDGDATGHDG